MARRRRWWLRAALTVVIALAVLAAIGQRLVLRDLRRLEQDYIAAREPTACATQDLLPFAFGRADLDDLDSAVEALIQRSLDDSRRIRDEFESRRVVAFPPLRSARAALEAALQRQVELYEAMLFTPDESDDELRRLGLANTRFERRVRTVRNLTFVGTTAGWNRRFVCDVEPPKIPPP